MAKPEMINHPAHYNTGKFEVIDVIEDWQLEFHEGTVIKYVARAKHKHNTLAGRIQDLEKAAWYLLRRIEMLKKQKQRLNAEAGNG